MNTFEGEQTRGRTKKMDRAHSWQLIGAVVWCRLAREPIRNPVHRLD
jgi:hypothetical protein